MWQKLLRLRRVGPHDDFFALGGDSLTAAVLLSQVEKSFRADLDLEAFMAAPTVRGLAALVRSASTDPIHQSLALTRRGGPGTPYFFVPGAGAAGRPPSLEAEAGPRAHYRLNYRGLDGIEVPQRTVPEMAAYFLEQVRAVQPAGPYLLGGGSFGALVALEAAHRLRDEGESVNLLVIEDSLLDGCLVPRTDGPWCDWLERSLLWVLPVGKRFELTWPGVREGLRQWRYRLLVPLARWRSRLWGKPLPKVYRFHDLLNQSLRAKRRHEVRSYPGPAVLLRTRFTAARRLFELEPTLGWSRVCPRLVTLELDGEKGDHITQPAPRAAYLERLDALLNAADDGRAQGGKEEPPAANSTEGPAMVSPV
jgi:thioesterase domain-containing protein/acyl carrier protein